MAHTYIYIHHIQACAAILLNLIRMYDTIHLSAFPSSTTESAKFNPVVSYGNPQDAPWGFGAQLIFFAQNIRMVVTS